MALKSLKNLLNSYKNLGIVDTQLILANMNI